MVVAPSSHDHDHAARGTIPEGVFADLASSLEVFTARAAGVGGALPSDVLDAHLLRVLDLAHNAMAGTLPGSGVAGAWTLHQRLQYVDLSHNHLSGDLPEGMQEIVGLTSLLLPENHMRIPDIHAFATLPRLHQFDALNNTVAWSPHPHNSPQNIPYLVRPRGELSLADSGMRGVLVPGMFVSGFSSVDLSGNDIGGEIPAILASSPHLVSVRLGNNKLTGTLPDPISTQRLAELRVGGNFGLTGTMPSDFSASETLREVDVTFTNVFGAIPETLSVLKDLRVLSNFGSLMTHPLSRRNSRGELLPEFLRFATMYTAVPMGPSTMGTTFSGDRTQGLLLCPMVVAVAQTTLFALLSPDYYNFEGCMCDGGGMAAWVDAQASYGPRWAAVMNDTASGFPVDDEAYVADHVRTRMMICVQEDSGIAQWHVSLIVVCGGVAVLFVCLGLAAFLLRHRIAKAVAEHRRRAGPPTGGREITMVQTDIEGSTDTWENHPLTMQKAISVHDAIMRRYLPAFHGYEVNTEGDSYLIAFHTASDAVAYCATVQLALYAAPWPEEDEGVFARPPVGQRGSGRDSRPASDEQLPGAACLSRPTPTQSFEPGPLSTAGTMASGGELAAALAPSLYRGLCVRMAVATGHCKGVRTSRVTRRNQYVGEVMDYVTAMLDMAHGGQVLVCERTFARVQSSMAGTWGAIASKAPYRQVERLMRGLVRSFSERSRGLSASSGLRRRKSHALLACKSVAEGDMASQRLQLSFSGPGRGASNRSRGSRGFPNPGDQRPNIQELSTGTAAAAAEIQRCPSLCVPPRIVAAATSGGQDTTTSLGGALTSQSQATADALTAAASRDARATVTFTAGSQNDMRFVAVKSPSSVPLFLSPKPSAPSAHFPLARDAPAREDLRFLDLGHYAVVKGDAPVQLYQALVPFLEERAGREPPPVSSELRQGGYWHAPATAGSSVAPQLKQCPHAAARVDKLSAATVSSCPTCCAATAAALAQTPVAIVFCAAWKLDDIASLDARTADRAVEVFAAAVRLTLPRFNGYECQEMVGSFMLAFHSVGDALLWGLCLNEVLPEMPWPSRLASLAPKRGDRVPYAPHGLQARVGICSGPVTSVMPHGTSGRADYFGPVVNRAARICYGVCPPGHVVAPAGQLADGLAELGGRTAVDPGFFACVGAARADGSREPTLLGDEGGVRPLEVAWVTEASDARQALGPASAQLAARVVVAPPAGSNCHREARSSGGPGASDAQCEHLSSGDASVHKTTQRGSFELPSGLQTASSAAAAEMRQVRPDNRFKHRAPPGARLQARVTFRSSIDAGRAASHKPSVREGSVLSRLSIAARPPADLRGRPASASGSQHLDIPDWIMARTTVVAHHLGQFKLKGIAGEFALASLVSTRSRSAAAPPGVAGKKATRTADGLGEAVRAAVALPLPTDLPRTLATATTRSRATGTTHADARRRGSVAGTARSPGLSHATRSSLSILEH
ncbi:unnamed protein product [Pedinophyceae sp. YPF-701]|nr:unnamed protein product [Pedinophyceae sp. YPF-701]